MFKNFLQKVSKWLAGPTIYDNLEAHIAAANPQTADDIDRLERGFYERHQRNALWDLKI